MIITGNRNQLPHYTYADYVQWEGRWELIEGIPHAMTPAPNLRHQRICLKIGRFIEEALEKCDKCYALLAADWKISDDTVVQPDVMVVCFEPEGNYITRAPELVFEVLSPSTSVKDRNVKYPLFEREGVKYYCLVEPEDKVVRIYERIQGRYVKMKDATVEPVTFQLTECTLEFDFSKIWP